MINLIKGYCAAACSAMMWLVIGCWMIFAFLAMLVAVGLVALVVSGAMALDSMAGR